MAETVSGTSDFQVGIDEIIETAIDKCGGEWQSGVDSQKARRILNLLLIQLSNKNIPLNKLSIVTTDLVSGQQSYTFDNSYQDILTVSISVPNASPEAFLPIQRYGIEKFNTIPFQTQSNRPNTFTTQRLNSTLVMKLWPTPDSDLYQARMVVAKRIQDVNASYQLVDLNTRYLPLLIQWLAYELCQVRVGITEEIKNRLKMDLQEMMPDTFDEDKERADFVIKPKIPSGR